MGYYLVFEINKHIIRKDIQVMLKRQPSKLIVLTIADIANDTEFEWIHQKEFRYKSEMYDIVREIKKGKTTTFICLHDKRESRLFAGLKRDNQNKQHQACWNQFVMIHFSENTLDLSALITGEWNYPKLNIPLRSSVIPAWSPPPEVC